MHIAFNANLRQMQRSFRATKVNHSDTGVLIQNTALPTIFTDLACTWMKPSPNSLILMKVENCYGRDIKIRHCQSIQ